MNSAEAENTVIWTLTEDNVLEYVKKLKTELTSEKLKTLFSELQNSKHEWKRAWSSEVDKITETIFETRHLCIPEVQKLKQLRAALAELDCALLDIQINRFELGVKDIPTVINRLRRLITNIRCKLWLY